MFGLPNSTVPSSVNLALESMEVVNIQLLIASELAHIDRFGTEGRVHVANLLSAENKNAISDLERKSVL